MQDCLGVTIGAGESYAGDQAIGHQGEDESSGELMDMPNVAVVSDIQV